MYIYSKANDKRAIEDFLNSECSDKSKHIELEEYDDLDDEVSYYELYNEVYEFGSEVSDLLTNDYFNY